MRGCHQASLLRCVLQKCHYLILSVIVALFLYAAPQVTLRSKQIRHINVKLTAPCYHDCYAQALKNHASSDGFIILALVDLAFVDMALNLYYTSLLPHNINSFLFIGAGREACRILHSHSIPCFLYSHDQDAEKASRYMSKSFLRKMNIRTEMIIEALKEGFTVLHTDLDMYFFANPIPELKKILITSDIAALQDTFAYNAGFIVLKPTNCSIETYVRMKSITDHSPGTDDQTALNSAINHVRRNHSTAEFNVTKLHHKRYACGLTYFEEGAKLFAEDVNCYNCSIVVHNNWIVGREAKTYRLKELHMWMVDKDQYYTNPNQKYLVYDNPITHWDSDASVTTAELNALKTALAIGQITGRVVILPRFHCGHGHLSGTSISMGRYHPRKLHKIEMNSEGVLGGNNITVPKEGRKRDCPLNCLLDVTTFDREFSGLYRESSFLTHPLVNIPSSLYSPPQLVLNTLNKDLASKFISQIPSNTSSFQITESLMVSPQSIDAEVSEKTIAKKFGSNAADTADTDEIKNARVLVFHNLYGFNIKFSNDVVNEEFNAKIKKAFRRLKYRQL